MNKKTLICAVAAMSLAVSLQAQNLNPRVVVTNNYEGRLVEAGKHDLAMNVPDSLTDFDLTFDYSVFEKPYKGSYEFSPYLLNVKPQETAYSGKKLYLKAGAGYTLHPELQAVFTPEMKGKAKFSIHDTFHGYYGPYQNQSLYSANGATTYLPSNPDKLSYDGYDLENRLGAGLLVDMNRSIFTLDAGYHLLMSKDLSFDHMYNGAELNARLKSRYVQDSDSEYDINLGVVYGGDKGNSVWNGKSDSYIMGDAEVGLDALVGFRLGSGRKLFVNAGTDLAFYGNLVSAYAANIFFGPSFEITGPAFQASLGAKAAFVLSDCKSAGLDYLPFQQEQQIVYPDIHFKYTLKDDVIDLFGSVTGGNDINTYSSLVARDHFFNPFLYGSNRTPSPIFNTTVERVNAAIGLRGAIASKLQYELKGGYAVYANTVLDAILPELNALPIPARHYFTYGAMHGGYAEASLEWNSQRVDVLGHARFQKMNVTSDDVAALAPAMLTADLSAMYNWQKRLYFGVNAAYSTERRGTVDIKNVGTGLPLVVEQWIDLGVSAEYKINSRFSVWAHGGNLLNQTIQRSLLHAEKGVNFTAGICLNL